jgi:hypothetical protein
MVYCLSVAPLLPKRTRLNPPQPHKVPQHQHQPKKRLWEDVSREDDKGKRSHQQRAREQRSRNNAARRKIRPPVVLPHEPLSVRDMSRKLGMKMEVSLVP